MARKIYETEFKGKLVKMHLEEGRTVKSLNQEYNLGNGTLNNWIKLYREECKTNPIKQEEKDYFKESKTLRKQIEELEKENRFLKKAAAFFAKEID